MNGLTGEVIALVLALLKQQRPMLDQSLFTLLHFVTAVVNYRLSRFTQITHGGGIHLRTNGAILTCYFL